MHFKCTSDSICPLKKKLFYILATWLFWYILIYENNFIMLTILNGNIKILCNFDIILEITIDLNYFL